MPEKLTAKQLRAAADLLEKNGIKSDRLYLRRRVGCNDIEIITKEELDQMPDDAIIHLLEGNNA